MGFPGSWPAAVGALRAQAAPAAHTPQVGRATGELNKAMGKLRLDVETPIAPYYNLFKVLHPVMTWHTSATSWAVAECSAHLAASSAAPLALVLHRSTMPSARRPSTRRWPPTQSWACAGRQSTTSCLRSKSLSRSWQVRTRVWQGVLMPAAAAAHPAS